MLSYQHGFHAGSFADVVKHVALTRILEYLIKKDKPLFYLDTHSGRGLYDLNHPEAHKTGEALEGIKKLWPVYPKMPSVFDSYFEIIKSLNSNANLRYYPGSPLFALSLLRPQDRAYSFELHPSEFKYLKEIPQKSSRFYCENADGLQALRAFLPPKERRALIFIDPSYEIKSEYHQLPKIIGDAYRRFSSGVYCIWYPIIDKYDSESLLRGLKNINPIHYLQAEFYLKPPPQLGMRGCGLWIINPPYLLEEGLKLILNRLTQIFNPETAYYFIKSGDEKIG